MSGPATHYIVGQHLIDSYHSGEPAYEAKLRLNMSSFNLGTMGPDFLFFNVKDWPAGDTLQGPLHRYLEITKELEELKKKIEGKLADAIAKVTEAAEAVENHSSTLSELTATYDSLKDVLTGISGTVQNYAASNITDSNKLFDLLSHPMQVNDDVKDWWWFDTMHYRKSGEFAKQMYLRTKNNPDSPEHAFAVGYMSHIASDVVGHPYVNTIVGGPYRLHPKRHKLVENHQDVWNFEHFINAEFCSSELYKKFEISDSDLKKISKLMSSVAKDVYKQNVTKPYGNDLTNENIEDAYILWMKWFTRTTGWSELTKPQPYELNAEIQAVWGQFQANMTDFSDLLDDINVTGSNTIDAFISSLLAATLGPIVLALAAADFLAGLTTTLSLATVRYFLTYIYSSIYDSYYKYRHALTLNGFAFPLRENLENNKVKHTYNPTIPDFYGNLADWHNFPKQGYFAHGDESHLGHPQSNVEVGKTVPSPRIYMYKTPDYYVSGNIPFEQNILKDFADNKYDDVNLLHNKMTKECLGNAVKLTRELTNFASTQQNKQIPNFSLDADRGIGYQCWMINGKIDSTRVVQPIFTDK